MSAPRNPNARIQHANPLYFGGGRKRHLDPVALLSKCGEDATRDAGFWICMSAAAHLNGYDLDDGEPSTVATYFPECPDEACSDCPPADYPTDKTRCAECPRRSKGGGK